MNIYTYSNPQNRPAKKALDPHLLISDDKWADDVRVESGYPVWNLIGLWMAADYNDEEVISGYNISREEWEAAKQYYLDHKPIIDARIIANTQPEADDDVPPLRSVEEYFAWLASNAQSDSAKSSADK